MGYENAWRNMTFDQALKHLSSIRRDALAEQKLPDLTPNARVLAYRRHDRAASYDASIRRLLRYLADIVPPDGSGEDLCGACGKPVAPGPGRVWICPANLPTQAFNWGESFVTDVMRKANPDTRSDCAEDYGDTICYPPVPVHVSCYERESMWV